MKHFLKVGIFVLLLLFSIKAEAFVYYADSSESDQCIASGRSIKALANAIGSTNKATIVLRKSTLATTNYNVTTACTLTTSNITSRIEPGAMLVKGGTGAPAINGPIECGKNQQCFSGFAAGDVTFGPGAVEYVTPNMWATNTTPGTTDMTVGIDSAIYSGTNVLSLDQAYGTTGGHSLNNGFTGMKFLGMGQEQTTFKRLSGTNVILTMTGKNYTEVGDMTFDGNSLGGVSLDVRGTAQTVRDLRFLNTGGTSYTLNIQGSNRVVGERLYFIDGNYGHINIGQDALVTYLRELQGGYATAWAIYFDGTSITNTFIDGASFDVSATQTGFMGSSGVGGPINVQANKIHVESLQTAGKIFDMGDGGEVFTLSQFDIANNSATPSTDPMINIGNWFQVTIEQGKFQRANSSTGSLIKADDTNHLTIRDIYDTAATASHVFFEATVSPSYVVMENVRATVGTTTNTLLGGPYKIVNSSMDYTAGVAGAYDLIFENVAGTVTTTNMTGYTIRRGDMEVNGTRTLANSATPSVENGKTFLTGGTTTITNFTDGLVGQEIKILSEHAITITDGTNIFLSGSVNFVMSATDSLTLVQKADGKWYEVARSDNT